MQLEGSNVLLLGASGGIGSAVARKLAQRGAVLTLVGRNHAPLQALAEDLHDEGYAARIMTGDLAQEAARIAQTVNRHYGPVDMLVNCAGTQNFGFSGEEQAADTARLFATNVIGPIQITNALLPLMLERGQGRIVHVGSIFGSIGFPCFASYSSSKFALRGYTEALRRELAGTGVGVQYVAPRYTRTSFNRDAVAQMSEALGMKQDAPEDVAEQVLNAILAERADTYLGWPEKLFVRLNALFPRLVDQSLMRQVTLMRPFARMSTTHP